MKKKELVVSAIENGTVIDHIPSDKLFQVIRILHLESCT
ncbi:MAG: aspartate carbamoyltransferase regulatory subunit, partial [Bacteroidales bacterium]|nr:aspartate carbamoyltransferase regulatory subunit [Bacteroidales bacterium]